jgi:hypothetical protein
MDRVTSMLLAAASAIGPRLSAEITLAALLTATLGLLIRRCWRAAHRVHLWYATAAHRASAWVVAAMLLPIVVRVALLPWLPPPAPRVHDEFGHLLVADTLLTGRLANPAHPLSRHLDTIYVLQHPSYASSYPVGQGLALALGKAAFGHPWAGVLLAIALMCGGITWMLYACVPPRWAAVGGLLAAIHYGLARPWVDTYWGGAFCAFGGALLFGGLCRLWRSPSASLALAAGAGWSIVCLIRPFESVLLFVLSWIVLGMRLLREPRGARQAALALTFAVLPLATVVLTLAHNRAVTGSALLLPYRLSQQVYGVPQTLFGHRPVEPPAFPFAEAEEMYWWQRERKDRADADPVRRVGIVAYEIWTFYITPWYSAPVLMLLASLRQPGVLPGLCLMAVVLATSGLYTFFFPHYVAAYAGLFFVLIIRGLMQFSRISVRRAPVGPAAVLFLTVGALLMGLKIVPLKEMFGLAEPIPNFRQQVSAHLASRGGRHTVFVRYGATHSFQDEWVYNDANVDAAPIVWLRSLPSRDAEVTSYYRDREFWIVEVEENAVRLSPYPHGGAGSKEAEGLALVRRPVRDSTYPRR